MTSDLMFPILFIAFMLLYISEIEEPLICIMIGLLFIPISFLFALSIGNYTALFTADITAYFTYPQFRWMFQGVMFMIPGLAFFRMIYIRKGYGDKAI